MSDSKVIITLVRVRVRRDANTISHTTVPPYEVGVLKESFGDDNVTVEGETETQREVDPASEHERLAAKFGAQKVEALFGKAAAGRVEELCIKAAAKKSGKKAEKPADEKPAA